MVSMSDKQQRHLAAQGAVSTAVPSFEITYQPMDPVSTQDLEAILVLSHCWKGEGRRDGARAWNSAGSNCHMSHFAKLYRTRSGRLGA
jgi:hypothetical protein